MTSEISVPHLDCCTAPHLAGVKSIHESSHNSEILMQCARCQEFWFYRFYERIVFDGGDDEITVWYTRLTADEAQRIQEARERPDLSMLRERCCFVTDSFGTRVVTGQPTEPDCH